MAKINPWKVTGYKAGQNVACKVNYAEKDGYAVTIQKDNLPGFIKTANTLKAGDEILGVFVCVHNGRILLSQLFSAPRATAHQLAQNTVNWEEHLNDTDTLDQAYEMQAQTQRNQRLGITGDNVEYQQPQSPTDFSQYQGNATTEQVPINLGPPQQDFNQYAPPQQQSDQQYQANQQYQNPNTNQQQYESGQQAQYESPQQPNPYQSTSQYDAGQGGAWGDPTVQSQYAQPAQAEEPMSQFQQDLLAQQEAARQAAAATQQHTGQHQAPQAPYQSNPYGQPPSQSAYGGNIAQPTQQEVAQPAYGQQAQQMAPQQQQVDQAPQMVSQAYQQAPQQMPQPQPVYQQAPAQEQQWQSPQSHIPTKKFRLRRAIDLVMPPVDQESLESLKSFKIADYDMEWLITDLEGGMRTGCIKATSEQKLSRSAALLYRGRAVGCIYGCKANPDGKPTEESLSSMLSDLEAPDAVVTLYDLPEDVTLAMSALFLGYPLDRDPNMSSKQYCEFLMNWLAQNNGTACLAVTIPQTKSTYLVFVHKGKFAGAFFVEEQQFTLDANALANMFEKYPDARIEASSINSDTLNSGMRFGYSLSMARQKRSGF